MPISNGIYWQQQSGGLCRMHSLNAYFGKEQISIQQFKKFRSEYDEEYRKKFNLTLSSASFDVVMSDQNNVVSYILKQYKVYTRYYALNQLMSVKSADSILQDLKGDFFFIYNENHIYGARRKSGKWYSVNSMGGVRLINIHRIFKTKNLGFIIPVDIQKEFYTNLLVVKSELCSSLEKNLEKNLEQIKQYLTNQHKEKNVLGKIEIPLGICMDILETNLSTKHTNSIQFNPIAIIVIKYNEFLQEFTKGRYNDIELILAHLPDILLQLSKLN
jgi:hypothetical protein